MTEKASHRNQPERNVNEKSILVLHNDDVNSFDHVIRSLVEICGHDDVQAEQCAMIAHYNGRCDIRRGSRVLLTGMMSSLRNRNLTVEIE